MGASTTPESDFAYGVETFRLAVVIGSLRTSGQDAAVADWFIRQVERRDELGFDVIDLAEVGLPTPADSGPGAIPGVYDGVCDAA